MYTSCIFNYNSIYYVQMKHKENLLAEEKKCLPKVRFCSSFISQLNWFLFFEWGLYIFRDGRGVKRCRTYMLEVRNNVNVCA